MSIDVNAGEAFVQIRGKLDKLNSDLNKAETQISDRLNRIGSKMKRVGSELTRTISLPLSAAGGAALKFASDFGNQAEQVQSAANLTEKELNKIKPAVQDISEATGQATDGIFKAFQRAKSSSLDFKQGLDLVEQATKATASGFGRTQELVNTTTTAFENFSNSVENPAEVLDKIITVSQNTDVEVSNMGNAFRRVSASSSEAGSNLDQTLSILSVVAERFGDTDRAGRAVARLFQRINAPTQKMRDAFDGLSSEIQNIGDFQDLVDENAIKAFQKLQKASQKNNKTFGELGFRGNAVAAVQQLLADRGQRANEVFNKQSDAAGAVNQAFQNSESTSRKLTKAWRKLKGALRPLGNAIANTLIPIIEDLTPLIDSIAKAFKNLGPDTKKFVVAVGGIAAAIGPVLVVLGPFATTISTIATALPGATTAVSALGSAFSTLASPLTVVVAAAGALAVALAKFAVPGAKITTIIKELGKVIFRFSSLAFGPFLDIAQAMADIFRGDLLGALNELLDPFRRLWAIIKDLVKGLKQIGKRALEAIGAFKKLRSAATTTFDVLKEAGTVGFAETSTFNAPTATRAEGGPLRAGQRAIVGERGPEVVEFDRAANVIPNDEIGEEGGGMQQTFNFEFTEGIATRFRSLVRNESRLIGKIAKDEVKKELERAGAL